MDIPVGILTPQRPGYFEDRYIPTIQVRSPETIGRVIHDPQGRTEKPFLFPNDFLGIPKVFFDFSCHINDMNRMVRAVFFAEEKSVRSQGHGY